MNRQNAMHKFQNALKGLTQAVDALDKTPPNTSPEEIYRLQKLNNAARRQLFYAHKELTEAILESLGF
jgi:DNA topoisomerase IA